MINERNVRKFCYQDISLIENYGKAIADTQNIWDCHHRVETIMDCGKGELLAQGCYYDRPAHDLIFLTHAEHARLHNRKGRKLSEKTKRKISEAKMGEKHPMFGKKFSDELRRKLSEAHKGNKFSEERRRRMAECKKGEKNPMFCKRLSDDTKRKISEALRGRKFSEEYRKKLSEARKRYWENRREKQ